MGESLKINTHRDKNPCREYKLVKFTKIMKRRYFQKAVLSLFFSIFLVLLLTPPILAQPPRNKWQIAITPYLWLPNIDGTLKYDFLSETSGSPSVKVGPNDYLESLDFALMVKGEARRAKWSIFTDLVYIDFSNESGRVELIDFGGSGKTPLSASIDAGTESSLKGTAWTLVCGYGLLQEDMGRLDIIAGFRYFGLEASTDWRLTAAINGPGGGRGFPRAGSISKSEDLWDGVIGIKGRLNLGSSNFYVPYYFDIGTGSSQVTWESAVGLAYAFKWFDIMAAYQHLYYDMDDDGILQDMRFDGPAVGLTFRF